MLCCCTLETSQCKFCAQAKCSICSCNYIPKQGSFQLIESTNDSLVIVMKFVIVYADVNECTDELHNCTDLENKTCSNTNGSFECICDIGYEGDDECIGMHTSCMLHVP